MYIVFKEVQKCVCQITETFKVQCPEYDFPHKIFLTILIQIKVSCDPDWRRLLETEGKWLPLQNNYPSLSMFQFNLNLNGVAHLGLNDVIVSCRFTSSRKRINGVPCHKVPSKYTQYLNKMEVQFQIKLICTKFRN